jgi:hypothetical protein
MRVNNDDLLVVDGVAQPTDMTSSITMKPQWLGHIANYSIQIFFTGSPTGTFKLQISNDTGTPNAQGDAKKYAGVTHWTDYDGSPLSVAAAGDVAWDVQNTGAEWVRVVYTPASGSGTITSARCKVKGV